MQAPGIHVEVRRHLDPDDVKDVLSLVDSVASHDSSAPLSEHVMLHVRLGGDADVRHLLVRQDDGMGHEHGLLIGYAHLDVTDRVEGPSAELCVRPQMRRQGIGRALVTRLIDLAAEVESTTTRHAHLRLWTHSENSVAEHLAHALGFTRTRVLWQMRRSLFASLAPVRLPAGITLRTFRPGVDDDAWVELNRAAFAHLPDQGSWTHDDLHQRMGEPWFDPAGLILAEVDAGQDEAGRVIGFHWTKVHGHDHHGHEAIGEVYVVGVAPQAQGTGLGRALVLAGLHHLRSLGLAQAMLYVDADNVRGIRLYESLGFTRWDTDVLYAR